jgi:phage tail sheath protein FI
LVRVHGALPTALPGSLPLTAAGIGGNDGGRLAIDDAVAGVSTPSFPTSPNAAVYFPRIRRPDPLRGDRVRDFAPAGTVAGVIARTDHNHAVWSPPAGTEATLTRVTGLSLSLGDRDQGLLNPLGVGLRTFPPANHVVWGPRTRAGADGSGSE